MGGEKLNAEFIIFFPSSYPVFLQFLVFSVDFQSSTPLLCVACCGAVGGSKSGMLWSHFVEFSLGETEHQHGITRACIPSVFSSIWHLSERRSRE